MQLTVLFENEFFIVIDKPYGWVSTPTRLGLKETRPILGLYLQEKLGIKIYPVHRLDTPVTGIILYAKEASAHKAASLWFERHQVQKKYHALSTIKSDSEWKVGSHYQWECLLSKGKKRAYEDIRNGKKSITTAVLKDINSNFFSWMLSPLTGRSHQLRFELYRHQIPILGDKLYGGPTWSPPSHLHGEGECIALRHYELQLTDIETGKRFGLPEKLLVRDLN